MKLKLQVHSQKGVALGTEVSEPCEKDQDLSAQEPQGSLKLYVLPLKESIP